MKKVQLGPVTLACKPVPERKYLRQRTGRLRLHDTFLSCSPGVQKIQLRYLSLSGMVVSGHYLQVLWHVFVQFPLEATQHLIVHSILWCGVPQICCLFSAYFSVHNEMHSFCINCVSECLN